MSHCIESKKAESKKVISYIAPSQIIDEIEFINEKILNLDVGESFECSNLSNEAYHAISRSISKSTLDLINKSVALIEWNRFAPIDYEALKTFDFGTALHSILLEKEKFNDEFVVMPKFNLRTTAGKQEKISFLDEFSNKNIKVITNDEMEKIKLMAGSALAHPSINEFIQNGVAEISIFFKFSENVTLKIRPDYTLIKNNSAIITDIKSTADINKFSQSIEDFRYHVQDAFYSYVYEMHTGIKPIFLFAVISKKLEIGKYPARLFSLTNHDKIIGKDKFISNISKYENSILNNSIDGIELIGRPNYIVRSEKYNK